MSRLYLRCILCGRQQADGLLSGAAWGRLELPTGIAIQHPAVLGSTIRACPSCVTGNPRWADGVLSSFGLGSGGGFSVRVDPAA